MPAFAAMTVVSLKRGRRKSNVIPAQTGNYARLHACNVWIVLTR